MTNFDDAVAHVRANGTAPAEEEIQIVDGVEIRKWKFKAGQLMLSHVHDYDHASFLLSGTAQLRCGNDEPQELTGPCMVVIKAGIEHALYAVTDVAWDCVHALKGNI